MTFITAQGLERIARLTGIPPASDIDAEEVNEILDDVERPVAAD